MQQSQQAESPTYPPFAFTNDYIPSYFKAGMYLVEILTAKLNTRNEPVMTFKVVEGFGGAMKNARRTENFFINSDSIAGKKMWREKLTELNTSVGVREIADEAALKEFEGHQLVMSFSKPGRDTLPNFRKATDFDPTWQPIGSRTPNQPL
jgi:hypothetical protein